MSEEVSTSASAGEAARSAQAIDAVQSTLERFLDTADVKHVYGEPIQHGDTVVIPTAEVLTGLGFGAGSGSGAGGDGEGSGGGGGGGGRTLSRPVAIVVISPDGVRIQEVVDPTKIALAAITAGGFMVGMLMRMISPKRAMKELKTE
ncbi:MAG TPA: spore germination protein GerW family protein [Anaerolineales bacterium]|nr:spore germination protein GerW family protein [Anaerolineales bacterium]